MLTGYFWKATHEPTPGIKYVSISRQKQRGAETMLEYPWLMPSWNLINLAHRGGYSKDTFLKYRDGYYEQLSRLDARQVYEELKDCCLVCFESPRDIVSGKKFCHRRMVAGWIETELGIVVLEDKREKDSCLVIPAVYKNSDSFF